MKIVIVSDTHGNEESLMGIVDFVGDYDAIIHAGDVLPYGVDYPCMISRYISTLSNIYFVRGNTDNYDGMEVMYKDNSKYERVLEFGDIRIFVTHGFIDSLSKYQKLARENNCDILVYGHTHVKRLERDDDLIILNPGSPSRPRDGISSFAILEDGVIRLYDSEKFNVLQELKIME